MENVSWYGKQLESFEKYRIGAMTLMMIFTGVYGAIGSMLSLRSEFYFGVVITATVSMASLVALIAQISAKWNIALFYVALAVNTIVVALGLAML